MNDKFKLTFDKIHAEDQLKEKTLKRIREQSSESKSSRKRFKVKRVATVLACFVPLFVVGLLSYNTYFTESAYVDLDINPSVELSINRFDRVINANAYNNDGEDILANLNIKNEKIAVALPKIIEATADRGQLQKEGLVSVTVQAEGSKEKKLLNSIESIVKASLSKYSDTKADIFPVDQKTKTASHDEHLSPAKYLAILALQEVDPTATISRCRHNSIGNIKNQIREHGQDHDGNKNGKFNGHSNSNNNGNNDHGKNSGGGNSSDHSNDSSKKHNSNGGSSNKHGDGDSSNGKKSNHDKKSIKEKSNSNHSGDSDSSNENKGKNKDSENHDDQKKDGSHGENKKDGSHSENKKGGSHGGNDH